jgi:hypothetical protein
VCEECLCEKVVCEKAILSYYYTTIRGCSIRCFHFVLEMRANLGPKAKMSRM